MVEDEHALAETVRRGLKNEGFVVDVAHDGVRGLSAALENAYDAILLDLMLPRMNGYDVLKEMRQPQSLDSGADAHGQGRRIRPDRCLRPGRG